MHWRSTQRPTRIAEGSHPVLEVRGEAVWAPTTKRLQMRLFAAGVRGTRGARDPRAWSLRWFIEAGVEFTPSGEVARWSGAELRPAWVSPRRGQPSGDPGPSSPRPPRTHPSRTSGEGPREPSPVTRPRVVGESQRPGLPPTSQTATPKGCGNADFVHLGTAGVGTEGILLPRGSHASPGCGPRAFALHLGIFPGIDLREV